MPSVDPAQAVLLARIRMALRRSTGQAFDVESLLTGSRETASEAIKTWRSLNIPEIDALIDQWIAAWRPGGSAQKKSAAPPEKSGSGVAGSSGSSAPKKDDSPPEPSKPDQRYLRGAR